MYTKSLNSSTYSEIHIDPSAHGRLAQAGFSKTLKEVWRKAHLSAILSYYSGHQDRDTQLPYAFLKILAMSFHFLHCVNRSFKSTSVSLNFAPPLYEDPSVLGYHLNHNRKFQTLFKNQKLKWKWALIFWPYLGSFYHVKAGVISRAAYESFHYSCLNSTLPVD